MSPSDILERKIGHRFSSPQLLNRALTHRSSGSVNNERLEYLGDSILGFYIAEALFSKFPDASEGDLSKMRAKLVRGKTLASIARTLDMPDHVLTGPGERKSGGYNRDSILADAFEAVIGAVYLDSGMKGVRGVLDHLYDGHLNNISPKNIKDNKSRLQELLQKDGRGLPRYHMLDQSGNSHEPDFRVQCSVPGIESEFVATGKSIKQAEQTAAAMALAALKQNG
jgi:ribonuclease-3